MSVPFHIEARENVGYTCTVVVQHGMLSDLKDGAVSQHERRLYRRCVHITVGRESACLTPERARVLAGMLTVIANEAEGRLEEE